MRVSWKWLNELIEVKMKPAELADLMTMSGVAVDNVEYMQKGVSGVKVGKILELTRHPQADKLFVCKIDAGEGKVRTIVTGADNLHAGDIVPVALPGAELPGGKKITPTVFREVESEGMLCSAEEIGLDPDKLLAEQKEGIYILPDDTAIGADIVEVLNLDDYVLELDLTPNRSDCLAMLNVAWEVAALTGGKVNLPNVEKSTEGGPCAALTRVDIMDTTLCKRYVARIIKNVKIEPSPLWMQLRLMAAGVRPINNIVDVTNYVMMEMGQPLHAFDYDCLKENRIVVRRAQNGETMTTLDGQERNLTTEMLMIADGERSVGIAGVMGGLDTEVTENTKTILLESAFFHGTNIRRTSQALGLRSEASQRFEKTIDIAQTALAADRAVQLMAMIGAGVPVPSRVDCYPQPAIKEPIRLRLGRVNQILGTSLKADRVEKILLSLQVEILEKDASQMMPSENGWLIKTPSWRRDLEKEIDLIEEIARLDGYNKIPTTLPYGPTTQGSRSREQNLRWQLRDLMSAQGLMEVITYSFIHPRHLESLRLPETHFLRETIEIKNPLSEEQGIMRTSLLPGLLDMVARNLNKRNRDFGLYELGKTYHKAGFPDVQPLPMEKWILAAIAVGRKEKGWASESEAYDFFYLKGILENIFARFSIKDVEYRAIPTISWYHPGKAALIVIGGKPAGHLGEIHPLVMESYGLDQPAVTFSLHLDDLLTAYQEVPSYRSIPRYPAVTRDLAVVVPEETPARQVEDLIRQVGQGLLKEIRLFDLYRGPQIGLGNKSLAFALTWQAQDRTMNDEEVNTLHQNILQLLERECGAEIRRA